MSAEFLAKLHAKCFTSPPPWNAAAFEKLLAQDTVFIVNHNHGFLLAQCVLDEAEILTLAVDPDHRRLGIAMRLVQNFHVEAQNRNVKTTFLEVSADNFAGISLYKSANYQEVGRRKAYYTKPNGERCDALVMKLHL